TLVLLMAVERIGVFADVLVTHGRDPNTPVAVVSDGTLRSERVVRSTLADVAADVARAAIRPPAIAVIGPVVALGG
ncbi:MAG TPA: uroporphyrinogen-III C-methyltransferase, partial [Mycobacterium sp.]|nr:uroporphyrinogen-III C-methyltransferase [Mycobacterium sp.]